MKVPPRDRRAGVGTSSEVAADAEFAGVTCTGQSINDRRGRLVDHSGPGWQMITRDG